MATEKEIRLLLSPGEFCDWIEKVILVRYQRQPSFWAILCRYLPFLSSVVSSKPLRWNIFLNKYLLFALLADDNMFPLYFAVKGNVILLWHLFSTPPPPPFFPCVCSLLHSPLQWVAPHCEGKSQTFVFFSAEYKAEGRFHRTTHGLGSVVLICVSVRGFRWGAPATLLLIQEDCALDRVMNKIILNLYIIPCVTTTTTSVCSLHSYLIIRLDFMIAFSCGS